MAEHPVAERLVDRDHMLVGPAVAGQQPHHQRFRRRQPVHHGQLEQQPEPVPPVRADDRGQRLEPPVRLLRADLDRGEAAEFTGGIMAGRYGKRPYAL